ncbi:putative C-mannosyltransferase DPY19L4 [Synchiropus picturatus]
MTGSKCPKTQDSELQTLYQADEKLEELKDPGDDGEEKLDESENREEEEEDGHVVDESNSELPFKRSERNLKSSFLRTLLGCVAAVGCGLLFAAYLFTYHDRKFWFSTRQELEREITFQEGSGIYYYYYKHMLNSASFQRGFYELVFDNRTIAGQTINAVERLSLYPELMTSFIYRLYVGQDYMEPIYFYIGTVFSLQAVHVTALFMCSWMLSGTWVSGMLTVVWYVINRLDTTKVDQAVPQRDHWALPYYSCQVAALTGFLSNKISSVTEMLCYLTMSATTFSFLLMWEHSHYILFIQALCLFFLDSFDLLPPHKVADVHKVYISSLFLAYLVQFQNSALLSSPLLSLIIGSVLARHFQQTMKVGPLVARVMKLFLHFYLVFTTSITFGYLVKKLSPPSESDFILKFLEVKFGLNTTTDFITNFLLCAESLQAPSQDLFLRLTQTSLLPFYFLVLTVCLLSTLETIYRRLSGQPANTTVSFEDGRIGEHPEIIYHVFHTLLLGGLTLLFDRVKYLWTPYVCMFTAFGVCSPDLWMTALKWLKFKSTHPVVMALMLSTVVPTIIGFSLWREYGPHVLAELVHDELEFYDPETVELISWIRLKTPAAAVFAGSPQLLATVKMCSGSAVTSLPLYSDVSLLRRTEDTHQVYALRSAEEVYKILTSHKTNYVIIEESICTELSYDRACRIKDLLDISNGHVVYEHGEIYSFSKQGRFCHEIKLNYSPYTNYFTRVFWNGLYHVYKVNSVISFQY